MEIGLSNLADTPRAPGTLAQGSLTDSFSDLLGLAAEDRHCSIASEAPWTITDAELWVTLTVEASVPTIVPVTEQLIDTVRRVSYLKPLPAQWKVPAKSPGTAGGSPS